VVLSMHKERPQTKRAGFVAPSGFGHDLAFVIGAESASIRSGFYFWIRLRQPFSAVVVFISSHESVSFRLKFYTIFSVESVSLIIDTQGSRLDRSVERSAALREG
jgi:hypothetical protein